jgi:thiamine pyrophosphokinase
MMLNTKENFTHCRSILCLNGNLPASSFFHNLNLPIIAADGAANSLHQLGISPKIIIGDLDSVTTAIREKNNVLYCPDQSSSDFQKSLHYLKENALLPSIIVGISGGYLDHILNNINIFLETDSVLYAPPILGYVLKEETSKVFSLPIDTKISLMGFPSASITSNGLKWELTEFTLSFPGNNSCFNRTLEPTVQIHIHQGSALILIYNEFTNDAGSI